MKKFLIGALVAGIAGSVCFVLRAGSADYLRRLPAAAPAAVIDGAAVSSPGAHPIAAPAGIWLITVIDGSGSFDSQVGPAAYVLSRVVARLTARDRWTHFRLERTAIEYFDGPCGLGQTRVEDLVLESVRAKASQAGTYPAVCWADIATRVERATCPVLILVYSDGDNDDGRAAARKAIQSATARLAANPHVVAVLECGLAPENRADIRKLCAPLGARLHLSGPVSAADIRTIKAAIARAR